MPLETLYQNDQCQWLDLEKPSAEDLENLHKEHKIGRLLLEDVVDPNHLPKYEKDENLEFFLVRESTGSTQGAHNAISDISTKIGVFLMGSKIITVHRLPNTSIQKAKEHLHSKKNPLRAEDILLRIALEVIQTFDQESQDIFEILNKKEEQIFLKKGDRANQLRGLYKLKRKIGLSIRILNNSSQWVEKFAHLELSSTQSTDLHDKYVDVMTDYEHMLSQITNLISLFLAISDQKANYVMKVLAIYSMYFLPLSFIVGLYGMNFQHMPELSSPYGYIGVLLVMATIVIVTYIYVKRRKW
ncbi:CorA family divalent cation transporter [Chryseobacterium sp. A301]